ncbi:MAG: sodium:solute symporter [Gemmatimonadales bacterium]|nr:MAG: sodium:solute symporter [Gemmatimonadales bacterium]
MSAFTPLDIAVLLAYLLGVTLWGAWLGRGQKGGTDYFLGGRDLPWWAVLLSVVATETSTLTFLSIPGVSYLGSMVFLQLTLGYLLGRILVSLFLLPSYFRGEVTTVYGLLEQRFGRGTRRMTSGIFMGTRLLADSVRLFATAIPLALVTGWEYWLSVAVIGLLTLVYTYFGGIRAVVWVDVLQMFLYMAGAAVAAWVLQGLVPGGWGEVMALAGAEGKLQVVEWSLDPRATYTVATGVLGGAVFSMASHGTDQLMVQRLLTCRDLPSAQKALVGSGVVVIVQFAVFLLLGIGLWAFYQGADFAVADEIFATFIVNELPSGVAGLLIAGVFAAAMSTLSSSMNALASASAYDIWAPLVGAEGDEHRIFRAGRVFTVIWALLLVGTAILYIPLAEGSTAVEVALAIASLVYGGLLGAFVLALVDPKATSAGAMTGIVAGVLVVAAIWARGVVTGEPLLAWPWFPLVGGLVTMGVAMITSRVLGGAATPEAP